jgi:hypothetical protein
MTKATMDRIGLPWIAIAVEEKCSKDFLDFHPRIALWSG